MKKTIYSGLIALVLTWTSTSFAADTQQVLQAIAKQAQTSLCAVQFTLLVAGEETQRSGIGICIDSASGMMLTTAIPQQTPAEDVKDFTITPVGKDGVQLRAKLQGIDTMTGLAFIRCEEKANFTSVEFLAGANVALGDLVVSAGLNAGAPGNSPVLGAAYISSEQHVPNRLLRVTGGTLSMTGSVVFNAVGKAIGLVSTQPYQPFQMYQGQRTSQPLLLRNLEQTVSFLPVDEFVEILKNIPKEGQVVRPSWIGGIPVAVPESLREAKGLTGTAVMLDQVLPGTPAEKAGLKERDIIIGMNGAPIASVGNDELTASAFRQALARMKPGQSITLKVQGGEGPRDVVLQLEVMPLMPNEAPKLFQKELGFVLREKVPFDASSTDVNAKTPGLIVMGAAKRSAAADAKLKTNDLVVAIDGKGVVTVAEAEKAIQSCLDQTPPKNIDVTVLRGTAQETLTIIVPE